jgi:hypothetical protein
MKRMLGIALVALPLVAASARAEGWPFSIQAGGSFYIKGANVAVPQAGPWYLYWPLEAHFVAPAPTGYPYWPGPQVLPPTSFGGPTNPPGVPVAPPVAPVPPYAAPAPAPAAVIPAPATTPAPANVAPGPQAAPQLSLPPYLQPTSYSPVSYPSHAYGYPVAPATGPAPSYWFDR